MSSNVDLHVHSIYSDGTCTPEELIIHGKERGLKAIALTDHDTIDGIEEAINYGIKYNMEIVPGVELSCNYGFEVHILGLFIDYKSRKLLNEFQEMKNIREKRNIKMVKRFNDLGLNFSYEDVKKESNGNIIGRPHFGRVLIKKSYVDNMDEAFEKYLGIGKCGYVKKEKLLTPKEAIKIIKQANGVAIVAHPGLFNKTLLETEEIIKELKEYGLDGIEVYHSDHNKEMTEFLLDLSKKYNFIVSGGSDFHGKNKNIIDMGSGRKNLDLDYEMLEKMKKYIKK